jgi:hypothetical protein
MSPDKPLYSIRPIRPINSRSPEQAASFIKKLQSILRRLGASDGDMEKVIEQFTRLRLLFVDNCAALRVL